jgi:uncharacterized surface protein with fasciclin (FAS1) repeats
MKVRPSAVKDDAPLQNVVQVAMGRKDHSLLATALKAAGPVDDPGQAGPVSVFAPTNAAFGDLPTRTAKDLLKPENKDKLMTIQQGFKLFPPASQ